MEKSNRSVECRAWWSHLGAPARRDPRVREKIVYARLGATRRRLVDRRYSNWTEYQFHQRGVYPEPRDKLRLLVVVHRNHVDYYRRFIVNCGLRGD